MNLQGKVALITGASSGIGAVTAEYFASLGAKVSLTGRDEQNLKKIIEKCKQANNKVEHIYIAGDVSKETDIEKIISKTINKYGRLDVLVNNAGIGLLSNLETITLEQYDTVQNTNVRGTLYLTKLAMPHLIKSQGNIVNISSGSALKPTAHSLGYSMSKAALDQFTKCVALELAPKNVRVNSVNPGIIKTPLAARLGIPHDAVKAVASLHPIGRIGTSQEVANAIAFLASDLASNVTGAILPVDGGYSKT